MRRDEMKRYAVIVMLYILCAYSAQAATSITTRSAAGRSLTWSEMDTNFSNLRNATDGYAASLGASLASLQTGQSAGTLGYTTKALMDADLARAANTLAIVTNDATASNNTYWIKLGAPGTGSWQKSSLSPQVPLINASLYADFATAVAALGSTPATLVVSAAMPVTTAVVVPPSLDIMVIGGGYLAVSGGGSVTGLKFARPEYFAQNVVPGTTDMTAALNRALAASGYVTGTGKYLITGTITMPAGTVLSGNSWRPDDIVNGLVLVMRGTASIAQGARSVIENLTFLYDQQNYTSFVTYPATIVPSSNARIENINYVGGTHFVVAPDVTLEKIRISGIFGYPLMVGIDIPQASDIVRISDIHWNPNSLRQVGVTEASSPSIASVAVQVRAQAEMIRIGRLDDCYLNNIFGYSYRLGVHQYRRAADDKDGSGGFRLNNFGFDFVHTAIQIDRGSSPFGWQVVNGWATPLITVSGSKQAFIKLTGEGTRAVTVLATNIKSYGSATGSDYAPAQYYLVDETTSGALGTNDYNRILLTNYELSHNTTALSFGFTADQSRVLYANGLYNFLPHGISADTNGLALSHKDTAPIALTPLRSWTNYDAVNFATLSYWMDLTGLVHIRGVIRSTDPMDVNSVFANLPAGYRPSRIIDIPCGATGGAFAAIRVYSNGDIQQLSGGISFLSINGSFRP